MRHYLLLGIGLALASCAGTKSLPQYTDAQKQAQREGIGFWQPEPAKRDSTSGPRVEPGSQLDLIRSIFEGHPPVVQLEVEAEPGYLPLVQVPKPASRRLFGLLPPKATPLSQGGGVGGGVPRKCKGCTFIVGDNNTVGGGKKSGDIIKADSGAIVSKVAGPGNNQVTRGNNNTPQLTAPVQQAADWRAVLAKYGGYVLASLGTVLIVGGCVFLIAAYKRRNKLTA